MNNSETTPIIIETSAILLTFRCNLKCKLCCTATPQRKPERQIDFPLESLKNIIKRYFEVVHFIRKLSFGGGEPTLYQSLPDLIDYTAQFSNQFEVLEIITNGTRIIEGDILSAVERHKDIMFFMIDDYGKNISKHAWDLADILEEHGIRHEVRCYNGKSAHAGGWVDLGDFSQKNSEEKARELLTSCCISSKRKNHTAIAYEAASQESKSFFIPYAANTNGLIHRCARAYSTLEAGAITQDDCFVNIMDERLSTAELQNAIIALFSSDYYRACEYCNGFSDASIRYEPAEQLQK